MAGLGSAAGLGGPSGVGGPSGGSGRQRSDAARGALLGVKVLAGVLSLLVLVGSGYAWATYRNFTANIVRVNAITPAAGAGGGTGAGGIDGRGPEHPHGRQ